MTTLVTGGDGFLGRHLIARLLEEGAEVVATHLAEEPAPGAPAASAALGAREVRGAPGARGAPEGPGAGGALAWRRVDVLDRAALDRLFGEARPERVFHLAGFSSPAEAAARPAEALRVNAEGTLHLVEAAATAGTGGPIVVTGSADAYGRSAREATGLVDETRPLEPETAYGVSKAAQEIVALGMGRARGLDVRVARLFPQIGPGQGDRFVLPSFCRRALRIARGEAPPELRVGNLDVERDFTDVRDGAEALVRIAGLERPAHRAYNIASGRATAVRRLLEWVLEAAGIDPEIVVDPELARGGEPGRVVGDPGRLREACGWRAERDLRAAAHETFRRAAETGAAGRGAGPALDPAGDTSERRR